MKFTPAAVLALSGFAFAACNDDDGASNFPENKCSDFDSAHCVQIRGGDAQGLLEATNSLQAGTTIVLGAGTFKLTAGITTGETSGVHIVGQGIDVTTLDFSDAITQFDGIVAKGDDFMVQDFTIIDSPQHGVRVESSNGVVFRRFRATWSTPADESNGAYGIYPVTSQNVLVEESRAENASDAGLYVGQCQHVIVRNNVVTGNVAGLEIENTQYADVYGNTAENNTAGIVVFDLPGNPIVGRDVRLRDNVIRNNNGINFAHLGNTVAMIPVGTGTFAMASRRVEITGNTYENNGTTDIAIISGIVINGDPVAWTHAKTELVGTWEDLDLVEIDADHVANFRTENVVIANNTHTGSGELVNAHNDPKMLGLLLASHYPDGPVDDVLYDTIGESSFDSTDPTMNSNDNHICIGGNTGGTFASMDFPDNGTGGFEAFFTLTAAPYNPFECTVLNGGAIAPVVLP